MEVLAWGMSFDACLMWKSFPLCNGESQIKVPIEIYSVAQIDVEMVTVTFHTLRKIIIFRWIALQNNSTMKWDFYT